MCEASFNREATWPVPIKENIESNLKAYMIRRQLRAAGLITDDGKPGLHGTEGGAATHPPDTALASPFDVHQESGEHPHHHHDVEVHHLPAVTEEDLEGGATGAGSLGRGGSELRSRSMSVHSSGGLVLRNSAPIPDLLPVKGETLVQLLRVALYKCDMHAWRRSARGLPPCCCLNIQSHAAVLLALRCILVQAGSAACMAPTPLCTALTAAPPASRARALQWRPPTWGAPAR
jgi:hypothetical protein